MGQKDLKTTAVRLPVDTIKALKMYCALTDQNQQAVINDAIVDKLKWEFRKFNTDDRRQHAYIIELLPPDETRPDYRVKRMKKIFKDPLGEEIWSQFSKELIPLDKEREGKKIKGQIYNWKKKCIKNNTFY